MMRVWFSVTCLVLVGLLWTVAAWVWFTRKHYYGHGWQLQPRGLQIEFDGYWYEQPPARRSWGGIPPSPRSGDLWFAGWNTYWYEERGLIELRYHTRFRLFRIGLVLLVLGCLPWLFRSLRIGRQVRRVQAGHCGMCGYDLRSSTDRCPECGTLVTEEYRIY